MSTFDEFDRWTEEILKSLLPYLYVGMKCILLVGILGFVILVALTAVAAVIEAIRYLAGDRKIGVGKQKR